MVLHDFIRMGSAERWGTGTKQKIQNEDMSLPGIKPVTPRFLSWSFKPVDHTNSYQAVVYTLTLSWGLIKINTLGNTLSNQLRLGVLMPSVVNCNR